MTTPVPRLRHDYLERPYPARFATMSAATLARHSAAIAGGASSYIDPATGYRVFTAAHLATVGTCCQNGCRHCPFVGADEG